jgi:hypothetical protein
MPAVAEPDSLREQMLRLVRFFGVLFALVLLAALFGYMAATL